MTTNPKDAETLEIINILKIFIFKKKRDLEKHSRGLVIRKKHLASIIMACEFGELPLVHTIHYEDIVPNHLVPTEDERNALHRNDVGPLGDDAKKVVKKISQIFKQRRYLVGHMFINPKTTEWHFLYFDQRDIDDRDKNHWAEGSHVHFVNWLWPNLNPEKVWSTFISEKAPPKGALHIKFDESRNQKIDNELAESSKMYGKTYIEVESS